MELCGFWCHNNRCSHYYKTHPELDGTEMICSSVRDDPCFGHFSPRCPVSKWKELSQEEQLEKIMFTVEIIQRNMKTGRYD